MNKAGSFKDRLRPALLLAVGQRRLVGKVVVHALVDLVEDQHLRPRVLQQLHLVVHLKVI